MLLRNRIHLTHHSLNFLGKEKGVSQSNPEQVRFRAPQTLKGLWTTLLLSCNFPYQYIYVILWLILYLLLDHILHEIRDQLQSIQWIFANWLKGRLEQWRRLLFVHWLESFVSSTIFLFSTGLEDEFLRGAESKSVWLKSALYLRLQTGSLLLNPRMSEYVSLLLLSGSYSDWWGRHLLKILTSERQWAPRGALIWKKQTHLFKVISKLQVYFYLNN